MLHPAPTRASRYRDALANAVERAREVRAHNLATDTRSPLISDQALDRLGTLAMAAGRGA